MVYKFRIISDESKEFARELLINGDQTFLEFHQCLQKDLGYDPAQLSSFFITNTSWEKQLQITLIDMMDEGNDTFCTMEQAVLKDHFSEKGERMLYVFDFFSERSFFIELTELIGVDESKVLPKIVFSSGAPPQQIELALDDLTFSDEDFDDGFSADSQDDDFGDGFDFPDIDELPDD